MTKLILNAAFSNIIHSCISCELVHFHHSLLLKFSLTYFEGLIMLKVRQRWNYGQLSEFNRDQTVGLREGSFYSGNFAFRYYKPVPFVCCATLDDPYLSHRQVSVCVLWMLFQWHVWSVNFVATTALDFVNAQSFVDCAYLFCYLKVFSIYLVR